MAILVIHHTKRYLIGSICLSIGRNRVVIVPRFYKASTFKDYINIQGSILCKAEGDICMLEIPVEEIV